MISSTLLAAVKNSNSSTSFKIKQADVAPKPTSPLQAVVEQVSDTKDSKLQQVLRDLRVENIGIEESVRSQLKVIVAECIDAFANGPTDLGRTSVITHTIETGEAEPFRHKLRPIPLARRQFLDQEIDRLLQVNAISAADPGNCPYASRTVLAPKKDGSWRMCVDYRDINAQTVKDSFPLPRIGEVWSSLAGAKYFASLDLLMGYHQVEVREQDRLKTAFITHKGLFVYNVMPFGLCNAPATFQRLMEKILGSRIGRDVLVYLDDVLIYGATPEAVLRSLREVLMALIRAGLKCKSSKCELFTRSIQYLGHVVSADGIRPDQVKLDRIREWPKPSTGSELASFLGLCNYYRDLVPSFAHTSDLLYQSSRKRYIEWTSALESAFEELKTKLLERPIVRLSDPQLSFILETDASTVAVGAVLKQKFLDTNLEHPVAFFSRALSGSERNYSVYELEMYAVVRAVEHFRIYLLGAPFHLRTDHAALVNLLKRDISQTTQVQN